MTNKQIKALQNDLRKVRNNINQLCSTVNHLSHRLGLGKKVLSEDFVEPVTDALERIKS